jgi:hypothetical protein
MKKRLLATALWFYAMWYGFSILADVTGMPNVLGPFVALGIAAFIGLDPMHRIWTKQRTGESASLVALEAETA